MINNFFSFFLLFTSIETKDQRRNPSTQQLPWRFLYEKKNIKMHEPVRRKSTIWVVHLEEKNANLKGQRATKLKFCVEIKRRRKKINRGKVAHNFCYEDDFKERSEWKKESTKLKNQREREENWKGLEKERERERWKRKSEFCLLLLMLLLNDVSMFFMGVVRELWGSVWKFHVVISEERGWFTSSTVTVHLCFDSLHFAGTTLLRHLSFATPSNSLRHFGGTTPTHSHKYLSCFSLEYMCLIQFFLIRLNFINFFSRPQIFFT